MTEPLFELRYERSAEQVKEAQLHLFRKRPSAIAMHVILAVCFVLNLVLWIWRKEPVSLTAAFCVLLIVGMRLWFRRYTLRTVDRREREMFREGPPEVTVRIYDDRIESSGAGGKTDTPISSFKRVFRTQTLLVPLTKGNLMYLLPTDAFIKGTAEECVRFFAAKGVRVS